MLQTMCTLLYLYSARLSAQDPVSTAPWVLGLALRPWLWREESVIYFFRFFSIFYKCKDESVTTSGYGIKGFLVPKSSKKTSHLEARLTTFLFIIYYIFKLYLYTFLSFIYWAKPVRVASYSMLKVCTFRITNYWVWAIVPWWQISSHENIYDLQDFMVMMSYRNGRHLQKQGEKIETAVYLCCSWVYISQLCAKFS